MPVAGGGSGSGDRNHSQVVVQVLWDGGVSSLRLWAVRATNRSGWEIQPQQLGENGVCPENQLQWHQVSKVRGGLSARCLVLVAGMGGWGGK